MLNCILIFNIDLNCRFLQKCSNCLKNARFTGQVHGLALPTSRPHSQTGRAQIFHFIASSSPIHPCSNKTNLIHPRKLPSSCKPLPSNRIYLIDSDIIYPHGSFSSSMSWNRKNCVGGFCLLPHDLASFPYLANSLWLILTPVGILLSPDPTLPKMEPWPEDRLLDNAEVWEFQKLFECHACHMRHMAKLNWALQGVWRMMISKYEVERPARVCELLIGVAGPTPLPVFGQCAHSR